MMILPSEINGWMCMQSCNLEEEVSHELPDPRRISGYMDSWNQDEGKLINDFCMCCVVELLAALFFGV